MRWGQCIERILLCLRHLARRLDTVFHTVAFVPEVTRAQLVTCETTHHVPWNKFRTRVGVRLSPNPPMSLGIKGLVSASGQLIVVSYL